MKDNFGRKWKLLIVVSSIVVLLIILSFWRNNKSSNTENSARKPGDWVLRDMTSQDITSLDPVKIVDFNTLNILAHCYEGLVNVDVQMHIIPGLAKSWVVSSDGLVWTFHLKKDVIFQSSDQNVLLNHNGKLTASDVVASLKRSILAKESFNRWVLGDIVKFSAAKVPMIEAQSSHIVQITLKKPFPLLNRLCMASSWIYPKGIFDTPHKGTTPRLVGTGPYHLTKYTPSDRLVLQRFKFYHGTIGKDAPREVIITIKQDPLAAIMAIKNNTLDVVTLGFGNYKQAKKMVQDGGFCIQSMVANELDYLVMNNKIKPFNDIRLRKAFNLAINRKALGTVLQPFALPSYGYIPPIFKEGKLKSPIKFNPKKARALLKQYQRDNPTWSNKSLELVFDDGFIPRLTAAFIKAQLKEHLDINIKIKQVTWPELLQGGFSGKLPFYRIWWCIATPTPDVYFQFYMPNKTPPNGLNLSFYQNKTFAKAYAETFEQTKMTEVWNKIRGLEQILINDSVAIPLFYRRYHFLIRNSINLPITPLLRKYYEDASRVNAKQ